MFSLFQLVGLVLGCTRRPRAPRRGAAAGPRPPGRASRAPWSRRLRRRRGVLLCSCSRAERGRDARDSGRGEEGRTRGGGSEPGPQPLTLLAALVHRRLTPPPVAGRAAPNANGEAWVPRKSAEGAVRRLSRRRGSCGCGSARAQPSCSPLHDPAD